jgi:ferric-dicitrate binding protein FerR (iron transport regulator)
MKSSKIKSDEYRDWLRAAESDEARDRRRAEYKAWYQSLPETERAELRKTFQPELDKISDRLHMIEEVVKLATKS